MCPSKLSSIPHFFDVWGGRAPILEKSKILQLLMDDGNFFRSKIPLTPPFEQRTQNLTINRFPINWGDYLS